MFPARAGLNRLMSQRGNSAPGVPRTRGAEPADALVLSALHEVFPARAGLNRAFLACLPRGGGVPRTRGAEPFAIAMDSAFPVCSPHARG